jgi:hypothetical protein
MRTPRQLLIESYHSQPSNVMGKVLIAVLCAVGCAVQAHSQDIVFSSKSSMVGRIAKAITGGDKYTHVGIVIDGYVYESDWPRVRKVPVAKYGKRFTTNDYYSLRLTPAEKARIKQAIEQRIGEPYRLRNYLWPRSRKTNGTWCSPFAGTALNQSGRFELAPSQYYEPQNLFNATQPEFIRRVTRH